LKLFCAAGLLILLTLYDSHTTIQPAIQEQSPDSVTMSGPLIAAATAMETAWDIPKNPNMDSILPADRHLAEQIKRGFEYFTDTPRKVPRYSGNNLSCSNCHLNAGQREKALPLVGVGGAFPEYNKRAGRLISLEDRIVGCFERSMNSTGIRKNAAQSGEALSTHSREVLALSSYITWLSSGYEVGGEISWRGQNAISPAQLIPPDQLSPKRGEALYLEKCVNCHGEDGQGVEIGDKKAGPLWGPKSWNDGAGAARTYTLAGMIRYMMPYLDPGSLSDEEAQHIAAYITSKPRPKFPFKAMDYLTEPRPVDAVYYRR
jgi:thiosulfate dehydrogenase